MPALARGDVDAQLRTRHGRWKMILLLLVCAAPVIASYFTYYVIRPDTRRNYGELIDPQRPLPALAAAGLDGVASDLTQLKGQWLLIQVSSGACAADCERRLLLQRQLREALGREKTRLDRVWLITDDAQPSAPLRSAVQDVTVLRVDRGALARWIEPAAGRALDDHFYLVDPIGNWMMRFPADPDATKIKRDLDRLLRASVSWDLPGR